MNKTRMFVLSLAVASLPLLADTPTIPIPDKDDLDVGVYIQTATGWQPLLSQAVNWKTGGVLKSMATSGIVKGDVNGHIQGAHGRNAASASQNPVILIYAPEGAEYTDYQFIHLHEHSDSREFRTVTGGVFHASGGTQRDVVEFSATKVAKRMWAVSLPLLKAGEYGFLPPGAVGASNGASINKLYTLHVTE